MLDIKFLRTNPDVVKENIKNASEAQVGEFTEEDELLLKNVVKEINAKKEKSPQKWGFCQISVTSSVRSLRFLGRTVSSLA